MTKKFEMILPIVITSGTETSLEVIKKRRLYTSSIDSN